jgi:hypothetical protein
MNCRLVLVRDRRETTLTPNRCPVPSTARVWARELQERPAVWSARTFDPVGPTGSACRLAVGTSLELRVALVEPLLDRLGVPPL